MPGKNLFAVVNSVVTGINVFGFGCSVIKVRSAPFVSKHSLGKRFSATEGGFFIGGAACPLSVRLKKPKELLHETHAKESFPSL
ncbi:MAG: hypothetical protein SPK22_02120 [Alloprevotella sp.]|nr:hypothetical protein [Bacteroidales bacterium]MDY2974177.1 hypothetical protein [Alloprevotella sp.]MDD6075328.1 hypothetical protein [Bacteroidales bacterium]MDD7524356.1 hypothetical protein [Bacteroidales bacterium]MDD7727015.1 hypothetical protein [Bacteroidales bacterium]